MYLSSAFKTIQHRRFLHIWGVRCHQWQRIQWHLRFNVTHAITICWQFTWYSYAWNLLILKWWKCERSNKLNIFFTNCQPGRGLYMYVKQTPSHSRSLKILPSDHFGPHCLYTLPFHAIKKFKPFRYSNPIKIVSYSQNILNYVTTWLN